MPISIRRIPDPGSPATLSRSTMVVGSTLHGVDRSRHSADPRSRPQRPFTIMFGRYSRGAYARCPCWHPSVIRPKYSWHPPPPVMALTSVRLGFDDGLQTRRWRSRRPWRIPRRSGRLAVSAVRHVLQARFAGELGRVFGDQVHVGRDLGDRVGEARLAVGSLTVPEVGTSMIRTVPSVPILSTMYFAPATPMP